MTFGRLQALLLRKSELRVAGIFERVASVPSHVCCYGALSHQSQAERKQEFSTAGSLGSFPKSRVGARRVRWASDISDNENNFDNIFYKDRVQRRIMSGTPPEIMQCRQNICKILNDANRFCDCQLNKIRAARCLLPFAWQERRDCVPLLPYQRLLDLCRVDVSDYTILWTHWCLNFWLRFDTSIDISSVLLSCTICRSPSSMTSSDEDSDRSRTSQISKSEENTECKAQGGRKVANDADTWNEIGTSSVTSSEDVPEENPLIQEDDRIISLYPLCDSHIITDTDNKSPNLSPTSSTVYTGNAYRGFHEALSTRSIEDIVPYRWYRGTNLIWEDHLKRRWDWFQRAIVRTHRLVEAIFNKKNNVAIYPSVIDEIEENELQNEDLQFEIRYFNVEDLISKLVGLKFSNPHHTFLCDLIDRIIDFYQKIVLETSLDDQAYTIMKCPSLSRNTAALRR